MTSKTPGVNVRTDPLDLPPAERLRRVRQILKEERREDWGKLIPRYIDPDARMVPRRVTIADSKGVAQVHYRHSTTAPGTRDGTIRNHTVKAPADTWAELRKPPPRRDPLVRVESMVKRYLAEVKQGNAAGIDRLGKAVVGEYWKMGMALTEDGLRTLAAASLQEAEMRQKRQFYSKATSPWAVK